MAEEHKRSQHGENRQQMKPSVLQRLLGDKAAFQLRAKTGEHRENVESKSPDIGRIPTESLAPDRPNPGQFWQITGPGSQIISGAWKRVQIQEGSDELHMSEN